VHATQLPQEQTQLTLFKESKYERFLIWKNTPGASHVLREIEREAETYATRYKQTGTQVSIKLIFEIVRDRLKVRQRRARRLGVQLTAWGGYKLNNSLSAPLARFIVEQHPDRAGMFEFRESPGQSKRPKFAVIVEGRRDAK